MRCSVYAMAYKYTGWCTVNRACNIRRIFDPLFMDETRLMSARGAVGSYSGEGVVSLYIRCRYFFKLWIAIYKSVTFK